MRSGWHAVVVAIVAGLALAGGLWYWDNGETGLTLAEPIMPAHAPESNAWATPANLPIAWQTITGTPTPIRRSTNTPLPTPTLASSETPVPPTPTILPSHIVDISPTPTRTPVHAPTDRDPTRLTIPAIDLDTPVVTVGIITVDDGNGGTQTEWDVADYAAGFHDGTARIGHVGNTVLAGHNNIRGDVFKDLYKLKAGDEVYLWLDDWAFRYKVSASYRLPVRGAPESVLQDNLRYIQPTNDERLTLLTCWPPYSNSHRLVVVAYPVPWND